MSAGISVPDIEGYVVCSRCQKPWVLAAVAARGGGQCPECVVETGSQFTVEMQIGANVIEVKRTGQRRHKPKVRTPGRKERIKIRDRARMNAMRRLATMHPVEFATILASERSKLGLEPWTIDAALRVQLAEVGYEVPS